MSQKLRVVAAAFVVALVASGCFRSDLGVVVNEDGSGEMTMIFAVNPDALEEFGAAFGEMDEFEEEMEGSEDPCEEIRRDAEVTAEEMPTNATVEPYADGDFCGVQMRVTFEPGDDVSRSVEEALGGQADAGAGGFREFRIERAGDGWEFEAHPAGEEGGEDLGFGEGSGDDPFTGQFLQGASNVVRIKLPGRQVEHNADRIADDGTMIWNLNVMGDSRVLRARTEPGDPITGEVFSDAGQEVAGGAATIGGGGDGDGGGSSFPWVVVVVLVAIAAIGGFLLWKRSQASTAAAPAGGGAVAGGPQPGGAPAAPTSGTAAETPQWDPARNAYIQWDPTGQRWMQYDDAAGQWRPIG